MADWTRIDVRLPAPLRDLTVATAARLGLKQSEYVREALVAYAAWHAALDAIDSGNTPEDLRDPKVIARLLGDRE